MTTYNLPLSVRQRVEKSPIEDVLLTVLRDAFPDVPVYSLIPNNPKQLLIVVRKDHPFGDIDPHDDKFLRYARFTVNCFAWDDEEVGGDTKAALLSEAVRVALRDAWVNNQYVPNRGWISRIWTIEDGTRVTDWATSAGPVQYADLPNGYTRYESKYVLLLRCDVNNTFIDKE